MNEKNIALIISEAKNFVEFYSKLLKDNDFKILKAKNLNTWLHKTEASRQVEFDICFVDNRLGGFQFGALLKHLKQYKPQAIVVNVSQNHHYEPPEYIQFFNLNSPT
ncbi:hypothetical protein GWN26_03680, partial [Candidatus Saccharibacteria bacterium]|nr:hypothetical protein [Calditrichia bacterium]NIV71658.1 hypothetical protein [Calditrichia bacterium]NIV98283.1 hypothetical protein [Candidatus Saccharibacteria bacterium]